LEAGESEGESAKRTDEEQEDWLSSLIEEP
jgi:hypothetical protein